MQPDLCIVTDRETVSPPFMGCFMKNDIIKTATESIPVFIAIRNGGLVLHPLVGTFDQLISFFIIGIFAEYRFVKTNNIGSLPKMCLCFFKVSGEHVKIHGYHRVFAGAGKLKMAEVAVERVRLELVARL